MTAHSSVLAWRIPGTAEPGGLPSIGSHRLGHDLAETTADNKNYTPGTSGISFWNARMPQPIKMHLNSTHSNRIKGKKTCSSHLIEKRVE